MKKITLLISCIFLMTTFIRAQIHEDGTPRSFLNPTQFKQKIPIIEMNTSDIDISELLAEDEIDLADNLPLRFAKTFNVNYGLDNSGAWETLPNGDKVWRLTIRGEDALNLNLNYDDFYLPKGAELYIYNSDKSQVIGAFTSKNNKSSRRFATELIHDDELTLEYYEPAQVSPRGSIVIGTIGWGYRDLDGNVNAKFAGSCQVNINCPEGNNWQDEQKGVARYVIDAAFLCSGTLINNEREDCTPYFSSANHCIVGTGKDAVSNPLAPLFVFYWNYECATPSCISGIADDGCINVNSVPTTNGATIVASSGAPPRAPTSANFGDFALFLLDEDPIQAGIDVFLNGWDKRGTPEGYAPSECIGIHHPAGSPKKISTDTDGAVVDAEYWSLFWEPTASGHSVTEGGSSGSPLFDKDTKLVLGQLFGGSSLNCDDPANDLAIYGGFYYTFTNAGNPSNMLPQRRLDVWLDPDATGVLSMQAADPDTLCLGLPPAAPRISFNALLTEATETSEVDNMCLDYKDFTTQLVITDAPDLPVTVTINSTGSASDGFDYQLLTTSVTLESGMLSKNVTVRVFDDAIVESLESLELSFTIDAGYTGNAVPHTILQTHTVEITDNDLAPNEAGSSLQTLFSEDFEGVVTQWNTTAGAVHDWTVGGQSAATTTAGMTGNCAFVNDPTGMYNYINAGADETIVFTTINASTAQDLSVTFEWACEGEAEGASNFDFGTVVYSTDGGVTFVNAPETGAYHSSVTAQTATVNLPAVLNNTTFELGFKWTQDMIVGGTQPMAVDNITVTGNVIGDVDIATAVNTGTGSEQYLSPNATVHFYDPTTNEVMLTIENTSSFDYGCTTVEIDRQGTPPTTHPFTSNTATEFLMSKSFMVTPTNDNANGSFNITLYYNEGEVLEWENQTGEDRADLAIVEVLGGNSIPGVTPANANNFIIISSAATLGSFGSDVTLTSSFTNGLSGFGAGLPAQIVPGMDTDGDGVFDVIDNCPNSPNPNQVNDDGDAFGAVCDCNDISPGDDDIIVNDPVPFGTQAANISLTSAATIPSPNPVIFQGGETVILLPGFNAVEGTDFLARIQGCENPPAASNDNDPEIMTEQVFYEDIDGVNPDEHIGIVELKIFPNPFEQSTTLIYELPKDSQVSLSIFDARGTRHQQLLDGIVQPAGKHQVNVNADNLPTGMYIAVLKAGETVISKRMIVLK